MLQDILKALKQAGEKQAGDEGKRIREELEKAYKQTLEHIKKNERRQNVADRKTKEAAEA